jgi:hypothetical protein
VKQAGKDTALNSLRRSGGIIMRTSTIALFVVTALACSASAQSSDDAAVFDACLAKFGGDFEGAHKAAPRFLVFEETTVVLEQDFGFAAKDLPKQLVDALLLYNSVPQSLGRYSPPSPFRLASAKMLGPVLEVAKSGSPRPRYYRWELLRAQFPDTSGILEFASPAYSPDASSALVYFWTGCGELCGSGYVYLLERSSGTWKVTRTFSPWIS